eukprot:scaffold21039_cov30-Attheya_sp.AAC.1
MYYNCTRVAYSTYVPVEPTDHFLLLGGVRIFKQLTGLEYTLCPSSLLVNTPYRYVRGLPAPARTGTECYARLPDEVMIFAWLKLSENILSNNVCPEYQ